MNNNTVSQLVYEPSRPSATHNLIDLYGLGNLASSVARFDPLTGEKRKLRKSYKNHIADLPGKHDIPPRGVDQPGNVSMTRGDDTPTLLSIVFSTQSQYQQPVPKLSRAEAQTAPGQEYKFKYLQAYEPDLLKRAIGSLGATPPTGIPDFDVNKLAYGKGFDVPPSVSPNGTLTNGKAGNINGSSTLGGGLLKAIPTSSSLHFANKLRLDQSAAAESSNDDATIMRNPQKKKKRKDRTHSSISPTSASGMGLEGPDAKRRKTAVIASN